ncbi:MAG: hypothetical protein HY303_13175 [Candidatus Wallbacteria bacterium]|nr:hypothetical protein [Candidatus Wallbacteria bacterium]
MRSSSFLVILAGLLLAQSTGFSQDLGQVNWRVTDAERRLGLVENNIANLQNQVGSLQTRLQSLDARFTQLVLLLDQQRREDTAERKRLEDELKKANEKNAGPGHKGGAEEPPSPDPAAPPPAKGGK